MNLNHTLNRDIFKVSRGAKPKLAARDRRAFALFSVILIIFKHFAKDCIETRKLTVTYYIS